MKIFTLIAILLSSLHALSTDKIHLEMLTQLKPFEMKVGEAQEIKFKALSNRSDLKYVVFLRHADGPPWPNDEGPLSLKAILLKQNVNTFKWDGESFGWAPDDVPKMGKFKKGHTAKYYFMIYIIESTEPVQLLGMLSNWHKHVITKIRTKSFTIK